MAPARSFTRALFAALASLSALAGMGRAEAQEAAQGWELCNQTSYVIEAALGVPANGTIQVEGWKRLRPGACGLALSGALQPGVHYLFARSSLAHRGGRRLWGGKFDLCVDVTGRFNAETREDCGQMGLEARGFRPVLVEKASWRTVLEETEDYDLESARAAGLQRLLTDAGHYTSAIDGRESSRLGNALYSFRKARGLTNTMSEADLIDALETAAIERGRDVGLMLCNRTEKVIWSAIARRRAEAWESRGWWRLKGGECARAIDQALLATNYFVYGELEDADGTRLLKEGTDGFCIARTRFALSVRESCEAFAYASADFVATDLPDDGKIVFEFFERDFAEVTGDG